MGESGRGVFPTGAAPPRKSFRFCVLNRWILVQNECFLQSSPKAGLNAVLGILEGQIAKR